MVRRLLRWMSPALLAAGALVIGGSILDRDDPTALPASTTPVSDEQAMRQALSEANSGCYANYRGPELQGCLMGVMQAHLEALESQNRQVGLRTGPRSDI